MYGRWSWSYIEYDTKNLAHQLHACSMIFDRLNRWSHYLYMKKGQTDCFVVELRSSCSHFCVIYSMCWPCSYQIGSMMMCYCLNVMCLAAAMTDTMMICIAIDWLIIVIANDSISYGKCPLLCPYYKALLFFFVIWLNQLKTLMTFRCNNIVVVAWKVVKFCLANWCVNPVYVMIRFHAGITFFLFFQHYT